MNGMAVLPPWPESCMNAPRGVVSRMIDHLIVDLKPGESVDIILPKLVQSKRIITHRANGSAYGRWGRGNYRIGRVLNDSVMRVERLR